MVSCNKIWLVKGENADNHTKIIFQSHLFLSFANAFILDQPKILSFGKELITFYHTVKGM